MVEGNSTILLTDEGEKCLKRALKKYERIENWNDPMPEFRPMVDVNSNFIGFDFGGDLVVYLNVRHVDYFTYPQ